MQLLGLLESKRAEIVERWADLALAVYPEGSDSFIGREKDRFRNPVGYITGESLTAIYEAVLAGRPVEELAEPLDGIVRVRAIQELSPTQALGFVFLLKRAVQEELGEALADPPIWGELSDLHSRIDQMALAAFDRFVKCREAIFDFRAREAKRQTFALLKRLEKLPAGERDEPVAGEAEQQPKGGDGE
jgi:hypothetical protein